MDTSTAERPGSQGKSNKSHANPIDRQHDRRRMDSTKEQQRKRRRRSGGDSKPRAKQSPHPSSRRQGGRRIARQGRRPATSAPAIEPVRQRDSGFDISLEKFFVFFGFLVGASVVLMCALDLIVAVPFSQASMVFDLGFLVSGSILLYLSWDAREGCR
jgi:hypothetical protein